LEVIKSNIVKNGKNEKNLKIKSKKGGIISK